MVDLLQKQKTSPPTGAMTGIPKELYEAACIDGATGVQAFFKITLPLLNRQEEIQEAGLEEDLDRDDLYVTNHVQQINDLDDDMVTVGQLFTGCEGGGVSFGVKAAATRDILTSRG